MLFITEGSVSIPPRIPRHLGEMRRDDRKPIRPWRAQYSLTGKLGEAFQHQLKRLKLPCMGLFIAVSGAIGWPLWEYKVYYSVQEARRLENTSPGAVQG
jgi:hypothetical protein